MLIQDDSFWSSNGFDNQNATELITLTIDNQYFVKYICLDPYLATQQTNFPVYTPRTVNVMLFKGSDLRYTLKNITVIPRSNDKIVIEIDKYVNGIDKIEIELVGFTQKQDGDYRY